MRPAKSAHLLTEQARRPAEPAVSSEPPSKTRRKQDMHALQRLGERLLALSPEQWSRLDLPEALREALAQGRTITAREGRRRQLQYIGKLMRRLAPDAVERALAAVADAGPDAAQVAVLHLCERWRDRLLAEDAALTELLAQHPQLDAQQMRATIRGARRERAAGQLPKHARALYRKLHQLFGP